MTLTFASPNTHGGDTADFQHYLPVTVLVVCNNPLLFPLHITLVQLKEHVSMTQNNVCISAANEGSHLSFILHDFRITVPFTSTYSGLMPI